MPVFRDLDALNQWLEDRCIALWAETRHRDLPGTIADAWEAEKPMLMAFPPAFDGFVEHSIRVSPACLVTFEHNRYSVPASFANRRVSLHVYPDRLVVTAEGQTVCTHVLLDESAELISMASAAGFRCFTSTAAFKSYVVSLNAPNAGRAAE